MQVRAADEAEGDAPQSSNTSTTTVNGTASAAGVVVETNACSSFSRPKV
jgi:hypothetical protein